MGWKWPRYISNTANIEVMGNSSFVTSKQTEKAVISGKVTMLSAEWAMWQVNQFSILKMVLRRSWCVWNPTVLLLLPVGSPLWCWYPCSPFFHFDSTREAWERQWVTRIRHLGETPPRRAWQPSTVHCTVKGMVLCYSVRTSARAHLSAVPLYMVMGPHAHKILFRPTEDQFIAKFNSIWGLRHVNG